MLLLRAAVLLALATLALSADPLEDVLSKLDRSASAFSSMTANLTQIAHTGVINEDAVARGTIRVKRTRPGETRMLVDFKEPDPKSVQVQGQVLDIYLPKLNTVQEYRLGKNSALVEQFLLLGFGTSRKDLQSANDVEYAGRDIVNGHEAVKLKLTPKDKDVSQRIQYIELWLSPETGVPLQHKIYQQGGDYQLFAFNDLKINPNLSDASLRLNLPKNVKKETPQS